MKPNRIILAGGSGLVGRLLAPALAAGGREIVVLTRNPSAAKSPGIRSVAWDAHSLGPWRQELEGAEAVVNLTGRSVNCRYTRENRRLILESRVFSTRALGEAIAACSNPPPAWLNASTATIYRHSFDKLMDENG